MFNFIKVKDNVWLNINSITSIEYYPYGNGDFDYLMIYTSFGFSLKCSVCEACDEYFNSPFSKEDMKNRKIPCLTIGTELGGLAIYFGDNIDEISKKITELGGFKILEMRGKE